MFAHFMEEKMMKTFIQHLFKTICLAIVVFATGTSFVLAEDIEIYEGDKKVPNVLFVIDMSGSMDDPVPGTTTKKIDVVRAALTKILAANYETLNVGYMDFSGDQGSGVDLPVGFVRDLAKNIEPGVNSTTENYSELISRVLNSAGTPDGSTPLVDALYEAGVYFRGDDVVLGKFQPGIWNDTTARYEGGDARSAGPRGFKSICPNALPSGGGSGNDDDDDDGDDDDDDGGSTTFTPLPPDPDGPKTVGQCTTEDLVNGVTGTPRYTSPIQTPCTENFIVLLSDGEPRKNNVKSQIRELYDPDAASCDSMAAFTDTDIIDFGECGTDLARYLYTEDQSDDQVGLQTVETYTIGFQLDGQPETKQFLEGIATAGGGQFYDANSDDPDDLVNILQNIVNTAINVQPRTIRTPTFTIDINNPLVNIPEVYFTMFSPQNTPRWLGNAKGYFFKGTGFEDLDGNPATDANGTFLSNTRSFWTPTSVQDGGDITERGVAGQISPASRNVKTNDTFGNLIDLSTTNFDAPADLGLFNIASTGDNTVDNANLDILINWARGVDVDDEDNDNDATESRMYIGDPLHSNAIAVHYDNAGTADVLFFTTNEGYLHAIDVSDVQPGTSGGSEIFAYMPRDLLQNIDVLRRNVLNTPKVYGLDGPLTLFQEGGLLNYSGDKYLYYGMRRGGRDYISMDVSNVNNPSLRWVIKGGVGDYTELALSWSRATPIMVNDNGTIKQAIVFGGGYDPDQDVNTVRTADNVGRAVFIADASDGSLLWSAGPDNTHDADLSSDGFDYSVPGNIAAIDVNNDGTADRLYFGNMGGQVWRIDIDDVSTADKSDVYKIADLASDNSTVDNRRFYTEPSVTRLPNGDLGIVIGSGYRAHPLDTNTAERLYMIYDRLAAPTRVVVDGPANNSNAVADITNNTSFDPTSNANGWKLEFPPGEKIMASVRAVEGEISLSTYIPPVTLCAGDEGSSRLLSLGLNGEPQVTSTTFTPNTDPTYEAGTIFNTVLWGDVNTFLGHNETYQILQGKLVDTNTITSLETRFWLNTDVTTPK